MALNIISLNCNGLRNYYKREFIFNMFKILDPDIVLLQETHCDNIRTAKLYDKMWDGKSFWSFGTNNARGVGILAGKSLINHIKSFDLDIEGRLLSLDVVINDVPVQILNVYAPNDPCDRKDFINNLSNAIHHPHVILGGDFNFVENPTLDKEGGNPENGVSGKLEISRLKEIYNLTDAFRSVNGTLKDFTWSSQNVHCRLDRFYLSSSLLKFVTMCKHQDSVKSDHRIVQLKLENMLTLNRQKGNSYWKCNTEILHSNACSLELEEILKEKCQAQEKSLQWWEGVKRSVKTCIIKHSKLIAQARKQEIREIKNKLQKLNETSDTEEKLRLKLTLEELTRTKCEGEKVRSKAIILNKKEHPSTYFKKVEKQNAQNKKLRL